MFVDKHSVVDREALRLYVLSRLDSAKSQFNQLRDEPSNTSFWHGLHDEIAHVSDETQRELLQKVEAELLDVSSYITKWMQLAVESSERFDFFVSSKAEEIKSGDQDHDYFWALQIRHDQLVALVKVLENLLMYLKEWIKQDPNQVIDDPIMQGLMEYGIDDQVYLEAENIHKNREKHLA